MARVLLPELQPTFERAIERYEVGEPTVASLMFSAILAHDPFHADSLRLRGLALVRAGRPSEAIADLRKARGLAPENPLGPLHLGIGYMEIGKPLRAAALFRRAARSMPTGEAAWINLSSALRALDEPKAARAAARRAVALAASSAPAHNMLGLAEMAAGDLEAAQLAFTEAIRLARNSPEAWINLVLLLIRRGKVALAFQAIEAGLAACPDTSALEAAGAGLSVLVGDQDEAMKRLHGIIERDPTCIAARLNLANALLIDASPSEALSVLGSASPARGRDAAHWRAHRALCFIQLGRNKEAERELDQIAEPYDDAEILILWRRIHLALKAGRAEAAESMAQRMNELVDAEGEALFEHRIIGHFDLARYHEGRGRRDRAFHHWTAGHRLAGRLQPFSREQFSSFIDASLANYGADRLRTGPTSAAKDACPVFVVGLPRSGTTLTEQILSTHSAVHGAGERSAIHATITRFAGPALQASTIEKLSTLTQTKLDCAATDYLADLHAIQPKAQFVVDKMPGNALHLGFIATLLPGARVIICNRDPRDVGLSIFQHRFFGWHPYAHDLGDLGWYINAHTKLMDHWRAVLPLPILDVNLSDWVSSFDETLERLLHFLGLPSDPACATFYRNDRLVRSASSRQVRRPVNASGIDRWKKYAPELAPLLAELEAVGAEPIEVATHE